MSPSKLNRLLKRGLKQNILLSPSCDASRDDVVEKARRRREMNKSATICLRFVSFYHRLACHSNELLFWRIVHSTSNHQPVWHQMEIIIIVIRGFVMPCVLEQHRNAKESRHFCRAETQSAVLKWRLQPALSRRITGDTGCSGWRQAGLSG